jgi:hypothetical protein
MDKGVLHFRGTGLQKSGGKDSLTIVPLEAGETSLSGGFQLHKEDSEDFGNPLRILEGALFRSGLVLVLDGNRKAQRRKIVQDLIDQFGQSDYRHTI